MYIFKIYLWDIYLVLLLLSYFTVAFFSLGLLLWYIFPVFSSLAMSSTFPLCHSHFVPHSCWPTMSLITSSSFFRRATGVYFSVFQWSWKVGLSWTAVNFNCWIYFLHFFSYWIESTVQRFIPFYKRTLDNPSIQDALLSLHQS